MNVLNAKGMYHLNNSKAGVLANDLAGMKGAKTREMAELKKACQDFEAIFIKQMLNSMRKTVVPSDLTKRNMGEDIFEDMLYDKYAEKMAETAGLGVGDMMFAQLSRQLPGSIL